MNLKTKIQSFDYILFGLVCALSVFGIIVIGSAQPAYRSGQQIWFATGLVVLFIVSMINHKFIAKFYWLAYLVNIGLLGMVMFSPFGRSMQSGVTRAISFGPEWAAIQPSEFSKIFMIVYASRFIDKFNEKLNFFPVLLGLLVTILIPVYMVARQPSLSASLVVLFVSLSMMYVGGLFYRYILAGLAIAIPAGIIFIQDIFREEHLFVDRIPFIQTYQIQQRLIPYFRPELASAADRWQVEQSVQAIGSGQFDGKGLYNGTLNQLSYLPSSHNDFIFAVIGEEFGYVGCMAVLIVIALIVIKCLITAYRADSLTGRLMAAGVGFMFAFQTFVNIGVAIDFLPNTGMALPFVSYGGSAMWVNMAAVGLVINIGMIKPKSLFEE